eukprot:713407-Prorocentrum_minimum.AAC.1
MASGAARAAARGCGGGAGTRKPPSQRAVAGSPTSSNRPPPRASSHAGVTRVRTVPPALQTRGGPEGVRRGSRGDLSIKSGRP